VNAHQAWKTRIDAITHIVTGNWFRVWPDLTREPTAPMVANTIEMGITHFAAIGGSTIPSVRVPQARADSGPEGARGAAKRARRIREVGEKSNLSNLLTMWFGDYSGAGTAAGFVWADFDKPAAERNPRYHRLDPRFYYPIIGENGEVLECLVARVVDAYEAARRYPQLKEIVNIDECSLEEWFWFEPTRIRHMIVDISPKGRKNKTGIIIVDLENPMGIVPVVEVKRPSFDGERRGMHDQTIHILRTQQHLMALTIEKTEEEVYSPVGYYDVEDIGTFGPGSMHRFRSPDARIERYSPQNNFDVKDLIARLEEQARSQSAYPQQLSGEPGASIASNRAIQGSMGALNARLSVAHKQFEWFLAALDSLVLRVDETFCEGNKTIYGDSHDRAKPESYKPSRDVAGAYEVERSYGIGAGADPTNRETRIQMAIASRLISLETARQETDYISETLDEDKRIAKEAMIDAINMGMVQQAGQGNVGIALKFFKMLNDPELTMEEVLVKLAEEQEKEAQAAAAAAAQGPSGPPGGGPSPMEQGAMVESLTRGGIPGNAPDGPPAPGGGPGGEPGLPPLPSIMGPGAPAQAV
jgi:hypothetical protein